MNKNRTLRKTIPFVIAMAIALTLLSGFAMTADAAAPNISVSNEAELVSAVNNAPADPVSYTIALISDIEMTDALTIPGGKNIVLISGKGGPFSLFGADDIETIHVYGKLTLGTTDLDGIIVTHKAGDYGNGVEVGNHNGDSGVLIMNSGEITENAATNPDGTASGGGVVVYDGLFKMYGGTISNSSAIMEGGGVTLSSKATFEMYGGTITNSRGSNVELWGVFRMYDGEIVGNNLHGRGVNILDSGLFEMYGGTIADHEYSGGVRISGKFALFEMYGGTIENNTAGGTGGGVFVREGTFKMYGGTIAGNNVYNLYGNESGGGVSVNSPYTSSSHSSFEMYGGTIVGNNAKYGGGVAVHYAPHTSGSHEWVSFEMYGGTIEENYARESGGGVWVPDTNRNFSVFKIPADAVGVVFSNNFAAGAYDRDPADDDAYAMYILGDVTWSDPFTQGYNNFDVSYGVGTPLTFNTLFFEVNADDDDVKGLISDSKPILFDKPFGKLPALKRDGYVLTGWFTEAEDGEEITSSTIVPEAEDYVVYAQWTEYVDTGGDGDGKDSGSGFGQAVIVNNINDDKNDNKPDQNNSVTDKKPAPPVMGTPGGDSADSQNTSTGGMRGALFWVMVLLTAPAIAAGFIFYKNKGKV
ncbi:MAG: InlB B-repeat-containing protein [Methanimicrococcus sp.]|nr:InlB B-repeat-containing protein [Methanimicrococcus sp.]